MKTLPKLLILLSGLLSLPAAAVENTVITKKESSDGAKIYVSPEYYTMQGSGVSFAGAGVSAGFASKFSETWGYGGEIRQAYSTGRFTLYTALSLRLVFALSGQLTKKTRSLNHGGWRSYQYESENTSGLRTEFGISQYSLNTTNQSLPFSGFSGGLFYELNLGRQYSLDIGSSADLLTNSKQNITVIRFFLRNLLQI